MYSCRVARQCWELVAEYTGLECNELGSLAAGDWIIVYRNPGRQSQLSAKVLIGNCAWCLWKARCELIFNNKEAQPRQIARHVIATTQAHIGRTKGQLREYLNFAIYNNAISFMSHASYAADSSFVGTGYVIIMGSNIIIAAGCEGVAVHSSLQAEILAINKAFELCRSMNLVPNRVCSDCIRALELIEAKEQLDKSQYQNEINQVREKINLLPLMEVKYCPRELNILAGALANHARRNPDLSLFHRGADRPRWLEDTTLTAGLSF